MQSLPPLGYQSLQHQSDAAFCARWGKRIIILWLCMFVLSVMLGLLGFLLGIFGIISAVESNKKFQRGFGNVTTSSEMDQQRREIERKLEARYQASRGRSGASLQEDLLNAAAENIADWDRQIADDIGQQIKDGIEQHQKSSYQGLPGHYDKEGFPGHHR